MSIAEDVAFKVDQLSYKIHENEEKQKKLIGGLNIEVRALHARLVKLREGALQKEKDQAVSPVLDDTWTRHIEWEIDRCSERFRTMGKNESLYSPEFTVLGFQGVKLEFFPSGRDSTNIEGFCSLFLWCPPGVRVKYQLRVGEYTGPPDEDDYTSRMGHGHSNFCLLAAQINEKTDTLTVGIDILSIAGTQEVTGVRECIKLYKSSPEKLLDVEAKILRNRDVDSVEWTIKNIRKRIREVPRGLALCSPLFSAAGVPEMLMEFYPNGIKGSTKEGFCGFYLRCPSGTSLIITLYVASSHKGPIKTDFDGHSAKGLPEFCLLKEQLADDQEDLVVGIKLRNPVLEKEETLTSLVLSSDDKSFG